MKEDNITQLTEDDREALEALMEERFPRIEPWEKRNPPMRGDDAYTDARDDERSAIEEFIDLALDAGFSRAAAPDAATELLAAHKCHDSAERAYERTIRAEAERDAALAECRTLRGERNTFENDLAAETDRDKAALAALERARALAYGNFKGQEDLPVDRYALKAALDGGKTNE